MAGSGSGLMDMIAPLHLQLMCMPQKWCMHFWRAADSRLIILYNDVEKTVHDTKAKMSVQCSIRDFLKAD